MCLLKIWLSKIFMYISCLVLTLENIKYKITIDVWFYMSVHWKPDEIMIPVTFLLKTSFQIGCTEWDFLPFILLLKSKRITSFLWVSHLLPYTHYTPQSACCYLNPHPGLSQLDPPSILRFTFSETREEKQSFNKWASFSCSQTGKFTHICLST